VSDAEKPPMASFQVKEPGFDMFAGAKGVYPEIDSIARESPLRDASDLNRIGESVSKASAKVGRTGLSS
jgi:hypothetical protein